MIRIVVSRVNVPAPVLDCLFTLLALWLHRHSGHQLGSQAESHCNSQPTRYSAITVSHYSHGVLLHYQSTCLFPHLDHNTFNGVYTVALRPLAGYQTVTVDALDSMALHVVRWGGCLRHEIPHPFLLPLAASDHDSFSLPATLVALHALTFACHLSRCFHFRLSLV